MAQRLLAVELAPALLQALPNPYDAASAIAPAATPAATMRVQPAQGHATGSSLSVPLKALVCHEANTPTTNALCHCV